MKDSKHQRNPSETAPSADHTKSICTNRERSSTDVLKAGGSYISCLSMKSDFSKGQPPLFSCDPPDNDSCECPNNTQHYLHTPKEAGQMPGHCFEDFLLSEQNDDGLLEEYQKKLKLSLKQKYEPLIEGLRTQSIRVYLTEGLREDLHQMEQTLTKQKSPQSTIDCTDLFSPDRGASVRTVLTTGPAGVGKSVLVQRSIVDWCEDKALQHIQLLCPLPFSQLNLLQQESMSLMELLQTFCPGLRESGLTDLSHYRLLFILDGLDQCRLPLDFSTKHKCCDTEAPMPVGALLTNLMLGNLLPDAQLWITCRPAAASSIPPTLIHRVSEVRGFNSRQQEDYFLQNIQDEDQARRVLAKVRSSAPLHSMCLLPLFCSIAASVCDTSSMTQMFLHFLSCHMMNMQHKYGLHHSRVSTVIRSLSKLAHQLLQRGELLFHEDHVRACGAEVREALVYSGLCTQVFREDGCGGHWSFSFVHLSVQEFLAALFVHTSLCGDREDLPGALRDHPLSLQFLMELSMDSSASLLTRMDTQRGSSDESLTQTPTEDQLLLRAVQIHEPAPPSERDEPTVGPSLPSETYNRNPATRGNKAVSSLCRSQARMNGEGRAKEGVWSKMFAWWKKYHKIQTIERT